MIDKLEGLEAFLEFGRVGDTYVYHVGAFANDMIRHQQPGLLAIQTLLNKNKRRLHLTQRREGPNVYQYRATLRDPTIPWRKSRRIAGQACV